MKALVAAIVLLALATGGGYLLLSEGDPDRGVPDRSGTAGSSPRDAAALDRPSEDELSGSSCRRLAGVAARLADGGVGALSLLRELGRRVAGIRPPPRAFADLARGGRDLLPGRGFRARYDDGSEGQARHFAGIAVATTVVGGAGAIRLISERLRDDPRGSADGRLTEAGIEFATSLRSGELDPADAPRWVLDELCRRR